MNFYLDYNNFAKKMKGGRMNFYLDYNNLEIYFCDKETFEWLQKPKYILISHEEAHTLLRLGLYDLWVHSIDFGILLKGPKRIPSY